MAFEKKRKIKDAIADGTPIPTELRKEAFELNKQIVYDDESTVPTNHVDDEYAQAGVIDPKILITSSRDPSSRLINFIKELRLCFPNSTRMNRGNTVISEIVQAAKTNDFTDIIILHEHRGQPDGMIVCHLPFGPTAYFGLANVVLRHDLVDDKLGTVSEQYPHLIFDNFKTKLGERISNILKYLYPVVTKSDTRRIMTYTNKEDVISYRHHTYKKAKGGEFELGEVGPRFELIPYQLRLGTVDQPEAENEWVLRPYMNSAKKKKTL